MRAIFILSPELEPLYSRKYPTVETRYRAMKKSTSREAFPDDAGVAQVFGKALNEEYLRWAKS
jgi:hypothetical protein